MRTALLSPLLGLLLAAPATAQGLGQVLGQLDGKALTPGWMDNYVDGVLHDIGWATHVMPDSYPSGTGTARTDGGGYLNALRRLRADSAFYTAHVSNFASTLIMSAPELTAWANHYFDTHFGELDLNDFNGIYQAGSSFCFQGMVFAPVRTGPGTFSHWQYPELAHMAAAAGNLQLYGNIGFANNQYFYHGEWEFNVRHGQQRKTPDAIWQPMGLLLPAGVSANTFIEKLAYNDGIPKPYYHALLDVRHPTVLAEGLRSIRSAIDIAPDMKFFVGGEYFLARYAGGSLPATGYSQHSIEGFRVFLQRRYPTDAALNAAWKTTGLTRSGITPAQIKADSSPTPAIDFRAYLDEQRTELDILQYSTAKDHKRTGTYGLLKHGFRHIEEGWLHSDFPCSWSWYEHEPDYFAPMGHHLYREAALMRSAGRPGSFGITSPATNLTGVPVAIKFASPEPWLQRSHSADHTRLLVHDILSSGNFHLGYYKAPGHYATYGTTGADELASVLQHLKSIQTTRLRFTTPYHRVHVHLDAHRLDHTADDAETVAVLQRLESQQAPYSLFSKSRALDERLFARSLIRRGTLVSPFHRDVTADQGALFARYRAIANQSAPRPKVGVFVDLTTAITLSNQNQLLGLTHVVSLGSTWVYRDAASQFYFYVFNDVSPAAIHAATDHLLGLNATEPAVAVQTVPAQAPGSRVHVNFVSDGLNFFAALSNRDLTQTTTVQSLQVSGAIAARFGTSVTAWVPDVAGPYVLAPRQTIYVYLGAQVAGSYTTNDLGIELGVMNTRINQRGTEGFDVTHAQRLHQYASQLHALTGHNERVLAALVRLRRMLVLKVDRNGQQFGVTARRLDGTPVVGAPIQLLHLGNGHQEADAGHTGTGTVYVKFEAPAEQRWDFATRTWITPPLVPATDPIEVHVGDPATGAHAFVVR